MFLLMSLFYVRLDTRRDKGRISTSSETFSIFNKCTEEWPDVIPHERGKDWIDPFSSEYVGGEKLSATSLEQTSFY